MVKMIDGLGSLIHLDNIQWSLFMDYGVHMNSQSFTSACGISVSSKVNIFVWKLYKIRYQLSWIWHRGVWFKEHKWFVECVRGRKNQHLTCFECELASQVWMECLNQWVLQATFHFNCKTHFLQFYGLFNGRQESKVMWQAVWFRIIWEIWTCRNQLFLKAMRKDKDSISKSEKIKSQTWINARRSEFKLLTVIFGFRNQIRQ